MIQFHSMVDLRGVTKTFGDVVIARVFLARIEAVRRHAPTGHVPFLIQHEDRILLHAFNEQTEMLFAFPQLFLRPLAVRNIGDNSADGVNASLCSS